MTGTRCQASGSLRKRLVESFRQVNTRVFLLRLFVAVLAVLLQAPTAAREEHDPSAGSGRASAPDLASPAAPVIHRYWPDTQSYAVDFGTTIDFSIGADDSDGDLRATEWYLGSSFQLWDEWYERPLNYAESIWSHTFDSAGTFYVFAYVYDDAGNQPYIMWEITVLPPPPVLQRTPSSLTQSCTQGQNAASQSFEVWNSGGGSMSYTITDNRAWLSVSPASGDSSSEHDSIRVDYATSGLSAGSYTGTITISADGATGSPKTVGVTLTVNPPPPQLERAPSLLSPSANEGENATSQSFEIWNSGGGSMSYTISESSTWLSVTPASGSSSGEHDTIQVNYTTAFLAPGSYGATITITASGATGSPKNVSVALTVSPPSVIVSSPNGGETWKVGELRAITWSTTGTLDPYVDIQYSPDNGNSWEFVASAPLYDGWFEWLVPTSAVSDQALVKVLAYRGGEYFLDVSDATFTITANATQFVDQFGGADLNATYWIKKDGGTIGGGDNSDSDPENDLTVAKAQNIGGFPSSRAVLTMSRIDVPHSGAEFETRQKRRYGSYRAKLIGPPAEDSSGTSVGFFTYEAGTDTAPGGNNRQEIDVELFGERPDQVNFTVWYNDTPTHKKRITIVAPVDTTAAWHEYGFDWQPGSVTFFIDDAVAQGVTYWYAPGTDSEIELRGMGPAIITPQDFGVFGDPYLPDLPASVLVNAWIHKWAGIPPLFTGTRSASVDYVSIPAALEPCTSFSISPMSVSPGWPAGSQVVTVTGSPAGCAGGDWTASGNGSWITVSPGNGTGSGVTTVSWTNNPGTSPRSDSVLVAGDYFSVNQGAAPPPTCTSFTISPTSASPGYTAGSQVVTLTGSPAGCAGGNWSASGNGSWLTVAPTSGTGPGSVTVSWTENTSTSPRSGSATVAGNGFAVDQGGAPPPTCTSFAIAPQSASPGPAAGGQVVTLTGSPAGCVGGNWSASGNGSWLTVAPPTGSGPGSVTVSWTANASASSRSGTATVASNDFPVTQAAASLCTSFSIAPASATSGWTSGSREVSLIGSPSGCAGGAWTATGNGSWLSVAPANGSGPGSVTLSWTRNGASQTRSASATIAGAALAFTQGSRGTSVAAGQFHACAVTPAGGVQCWGANSNGQLGNGTTVRRSKPGDVTGLSSGVVAVAAGYEHTCALTAAGGVKCWGANYNGQLGDGTTARKLTPVDVVGLGGEVQAIAAGDYHSCAVTSAGAVKCWGSNLYGALGDGGSADQPSPVDVVGMSTGIVDVAGGSSHTCALDNAGGVKCWGSNFSGKLGDGTTTDRPTPVNVVGLASDVSQITAGNSHTCALTSMGGIKCWGDNYYGQLGDGSRGDSSTPRDVSGLTIGALSVDAGFGHTCAVKAAGDVECWGNNSYGQIGDGTTTMRLEAVPVEGMVAAAAALASGGEHTCAMSNTGEVSCWGRNREGQVGDNRLFSRLAPGDVAGLTGIVALSSGSDHACVLTAAGGVQCWGDNSYGQLGDGTTMSRSTPADVTNLTSGVVALAAGANHNCALTSTGGVKCWGYNWAGALGDGTQRDRYAPVQVTGILSGMTALAAGGSHTCALTDAGGLKCWGWNTYGQLGDGTTDSRLTPVDVPTLTSGVSRVGAGDVHTCAITTSGGVKCWGRNYSGELGDGTTTQSLTPVDVTGLATGVTSVDGGGSHTCAIAGAGALKCWGFNSEGQLGDGTTTRKLTPVNVSGLASGVVQVRGQSHLTCAVTASGAAKCWGRNSSGQLGDGTTTSRSLPVTVSGLESGVAAVEPGYAHGCALTAAGTVTCWGDNGAGQLGDGVALWRPVPVPVSSFGASRVIALSGQLAFGDVAAGSTSTRTLTIANSGSGALTVSGITYPPGFTGAWSGAVPAGGSHDVTVTFAPAATATYGGPVVVQADETSGTPSTQASGTGIASFTVASISPDWGPASGNTPVTLTGTGFEPGATVLIGGLAPAAVEVVSATRIDTVTPPSVPGPADVTVSIGGVAVTLPGAFTYTGSPPPTAVHRRIATGTYHTCAVTPAGGVQCWGDNGSGELGNGATWSSYGDDGSPIDLSRPVDVVGLTSGVVAVAAGYGHSCALNEAGGVKCWGYNGWGVLGDGTYNNSSSPVDVAGLTSGVTDLAAGRQHTCAVTSAGLVMCWGDNHNGQLGDGNSQTHSSTPVMVAGLTDAVAVTAGWDHTCALTQAGVVKCWGSDGTVSASPTALQVPGLAGVVAIEAGDGHTCALLGSGGVKCWGYNWAGQLGDGSTTQRDSPVDVMGLPGPMIGLAAGSGHTYAYDAQSLFKWGDDLTTPTAIAGLNAVNAVDTDERHTCAAMSAGGVMCWGSNSSGQLGDGRLTWTPTPVDAVGLDSGVTALSLARHSCAVTSTGGLKCWGANSMGELGDGTQVSRSTPADVTGLTNGVAAVAAGNYFTCAVTAAGGAKCWGINFDGQLGDGGVAWTSAVPLDVVGIAGGATAIATGENHACAVVSGGVKCWGANYSGSLGDGTTTQRNTPVDVVGLPGVASAVVAGESHTCALTSAGVWCWGDNSAGQLGDGTYADRHYPVPVAGMDSGVVALAAGYVHTCALLADGRVACWGSNEVGQLADGTTNSRPVAGAVIGLPEAVRELAAGVGHTCVVTDAGGLWCWGYNHGGQLGDGTTTYRLFPTEVIGLTGSMSGVAGVGETHTCALTDTGGVKCWGRNSQGELGDGGPLSPPGPVQVAGFGSTRAMFLSGSLSFGDATAGTTVTRTLTIANSGNGDLTVADISYPPGFAGAWSGTIAPGSSQDVVVTFTPTATRAYGGSIFVHADETSGSPNLGISGTGKAPFTVSAVSPNLGPPTGDSLVTITGSGFSAGATVRIGGRSTAWARVVSPTRIDTVTPPGPTGLADVTVVIGALSTTLEDSYTYTASQVQPAVHLTLRMSQSGSFEVGSLVSYTLTVRNIGSDASSGPIFLVDELPPGLTFAGMVAYGEPYWSCAMETPFLRCVQDGPLAAGAFLPQLGITLQVGPQAVPGVTNVARVQSADNRGNPGDAVASVYAPVTGGSLAGEQLPVPSTPDLETGRPRQARRFPARSQAIEGDSNPVSTRERRARPFPARQRKKVSNQADSR